MRNFGIEKRPEKKRNAAAEFGWLCLSVGARFLSAIVAIIVIYFCLIWLGIIDGLKK